MKKLILPVLSVLVIFALNGCGGSDDTTEPTYDVNYLTDDMGSGISGVPYDCITYSGVTDNDGAFEFDPSGDACDFDLTGLVEDLYIMNETVGVNGLEYDCSPSGISGITGDYGGDGGFDYGTDDICTIYY
ncbi:MAG: hypothetical protein P794_06625 [Epsilonproteobacteria bacterium (ex Lamellibrachia satsuma)]|nr:MAG: hypothetical protein P794_06625 [Epsilonproteobacteria bacterium (ex Lamellibrachia satsuma)]